MTEPLADVPLAEVSASSDGRRWTLAFVRDLPHPPEAVWSALVGPEQLTAWAPFTADRSLAEPGPFILTMIDGDEPVDMAEEVLRAQAPTLLEHSWGEDTVRWELAPTDAGTRLTLHHTVATPDFVPKVAAGWHLCLAVLDRLLAGDPVPPIVGEDAMNHGWQELHDSYAAALGIEVDSAS
jgi:uncharacterized protein YndB with AHSA1/START domain